MKKLFIFSILIAITGMLNAQGPDLTGVSICINPGHGGHDSDDRYIAETGFWESEGNLTKGLYLRDILENCGATIIMSRVTNFTEDDLPLSQIDQIANDNNVDYFHSIHSNAFNGSANYPLLLYRGYDDAPVFPLAKTMASLMWPELLSNSNLYWPYSYENVRGDWDFYSQWGTQGLGVLRYLNMPGVLSEGSFHDYYPESWRLQNLDYRKYEAWNLADAIVNYFGEPGFTTGLVTGVARDPYENTQYYWVPGSNDEKIPINEYTATLLPLNRVYQGDTLNNGVFFFDSIAPGNYSVIFEADGYFNDTVDISVTAGQTTIVDRWLPFDTTVAPVVSSHYMPSLPDSVGATESITFHFNSPMMTSSVETAFSITPAVNGQFSWQDDNKTLIFSHSETFDKATAYTVTLSTNAKSVWNVPIDAPYSFNFISKNRNRLALLDLFPKNNNIEVNPKLQFRLIFDAPLQASSLIANVILYNENNDVLPTSGAFVYDDEGKGYYFFQAQQELAYSSNYKLVIQPGIYDIQGTPYYETTEINFTTQAENTLPLSVYDDFEHIGSWQDPDDSQFTQGTDPSQTSFILSPYFKISGSFSGEMKYQFTGDEGGVCAATNSTPYNIGSGTDTEFGMWVFGDLSYNILEYWFYYNDNVNAPLYIDTIDWAGWDLKYINKADIPGSGNKLFHSIVLKQSNSGSRKGKIFTDDIFHVPGVNVEDININKDFYFIQNFPNPFKKITNFTYKLSVDADVKLEIFNLLGQKIVSIERPAQKKGMQLIKWNGENSKNNIVSSGTYFYKITAIPLSNSSVQYQKSGVSVKY